MKTKIYGVFGDLNEQKDISISALKLMLS